MNVDDKFEIFPGIGAGSITFGMTSDEVEALIGLPETKILNEQNELVEFRSFMNVAYASPPENKLSHIGFGRQMEGVKYEGISVFLESPDDVIKKMMEIDPEPYLFVGFVIFLKLGISLTGFHDEDIEQKSLAIFNHNDYEKYVHAMEPFKMVMKKKHGKVY